MRTLKADVVEARAQPMPAASDHEAPKPSNCQPRAGGRRPRHSRARSASALKAALLNSAAGAREPARRPASSARPACVSRASSPAIPSSGSSITPTLTSVTSWCPGMHETIPGPGGVYTADIVSLGFRRRRRLSRRRHHAAGGQRLHRRLLRLGLRRRARRQRLRALRAPDRAGMRSTSG